MKLANNLELPIQAVTQTFAFLGKRGGGKSYAATKLCELMLEESAQIIAVDVVGVWYGLRVPRNEKSKAFDVTVFGGLNGDISINPKAGRIIAEIIVERNLSAVVDISQFLSSEQSRFAYDFLTTVFERKKAAPSPVHIFLEEAQELVPQNVGKGGGDNYAARMLHAGERLVKLGRNFGIGCSLISQRPQEVNKKVLDQTEVLFAFQMTGRLEREAIAKTVADKGGREELVDRLPTLSVGEAFVWSPSWLKFEGLVKVNEKLSADVSATPEIGDAPHSAKKLAPVDVEALKESIAALVEETEKDTPANLKTQIAELKRQLAEKPNEVSALPEVVFPTKEFEALQDYLDDTRKWANNFRDEFLQKFDSEIETKFWAIANLADALNLSLPKPAPKYNSPIIKTEKPKIASESKPQAETKSREFLTRPQQIILDTLATFAALGVREVEHSNVAVFSKVSPRSSAYHGNLRFLKSEKLIDYSRAGGVWLTERGAQFAHSSFSTDSLEELHNAWISYLPTKQGAMIRYLINNNAKTNEIPLRELAASTNQSETSSAWTGNLRALRKFGLIEFADKHIYLTNLLFPSI